MDSVLNQSTGDPLHSDLCSGHKVKGQGQFNQQLANDDEWND